MITACPDPEEWLRLLDGEATENRAADLRAHADACSACARRLEQERQLLSDLAAPVPVSPNAVANVMRRLAQTEMPVRRRRPLRTWALAGATFAMAAAAALVLLPKRDTPGFSARGERLAWTQKVGMELWALEETPRKLTNAAVLPVGTAIVGSYRNLDRAPAFALAFALDAEGEVHWIYPGFEDPHTDPQSVRLEALQVHRALADSVMLDALRPGGLQLISLITPQPLHVSHIESLPVAERQPAALRARFPGARIDAVSLRVLPAPTKESP